MELSQHAKDVFERKGLGNGVKVRRVLQLTADLCGQPDGRLDGVRILDLGCGEGVYAIEAALRGAQVVALDGRMQRMQDGLRIAQELGLDSIRFEQADVRALDEKALGQFDMVWVLGLLYHLDSPANLALLEQARRLSRKAAIVDTHVSLTGPDSFEHHGRSYPGRRIREHAESESTEQRNQKVQHSLDNTFSFWPTFESAERMLRDAGFTSVLRADVPFEPHKSREGHGVDDRVTLLALAGAQLPLVTYPWVNGASDEEIATKRLATFPVHQPSLRGRAKGAVQSALRKLGLEVKRVRE